jgi:hypothetical protein
MVGEKYARPKNGILVRMIKKHFRHYDQKRLNEELAMAGLNNKLEIINVE